MAAVQGAWMYLAPRSFYQDVPTVSASGPFSQHLMSDIGGLNLAMALVLSCAAVSLNRRLTRVALAAYLTYALSHLIFHLTHLSGMSAGSVVYLLTGLSLLPAIAIALLLLTTGPPQHLPGIQGASYRPPGQPRPPAKARTCDHADGHRPVQSGDPPRRSS